jgi:hypothetical protein
MILLIGFYEDADVCRRGDFLECLRRNIDNLRITEIHVFVEEPGGADRLVAAYPLLAAPKVCLTAHGRRVTYRDLFAYANARLSGRCVAVANADIYFDESLALLDGYDLAGRLLCLSRWDVQPDGSARFFDHAGSQDAWIFQVPIREFSCEFPLGVPNCDQRLAWEADRAGLVLSNPSRSLRPLHYHLSHVRRYGERQWLPGPTRFVPAVFLDTPHPSARGPAPEVPCAGVAFRESMGYTVERLRPGVSSHNNSSRPFAAVPEPLWGLPFTQVVAYCVSPVEVEFLTPGKLYVLVGNDWDGHQPAVAWLSEAGFREALPFVASEGGIGFEVWSLVAEAGERFLIPTQVMLVADDLVKRVGEPFDAQMPAEGSRPLIDRLANPPERGPLKKDGTPDMRYRVNKEAANKPG